MFSPGPSDGLLTGVSVRGDGASVRGLRGARRPLLQLLQRPAGVQREVVQEWEGVLQVVIVVHPAYYLTTPTLSYLPGKPEPISVHDLPGITVDVSIYHHQ